MARVSLMSGVFLLLCLTSVFSAEDSKDSIAKAIESLHEEDREDFLSYLLGLSLLDWVKSQLRPPRYFPIVSEELFVKSLNISEGKIQTFQKMNVPAESRKKLLLWTERDLGLNKRDVLELVRTKKCHRPNCLNLGDIGPLCCPW